MSKKLTPISWKQKGKIYEKMGYVYWQTNGSHLSYVHEKYANLSDEEKKKLPSINLQSTAKPPIIILTKSKEIPVGTLTLNIKKLRISRTQFQELVRETK